MPASKRQTVKRRPQMIVELSDPLTRSNSRSLATDFRMKTETDPSDSELLQSMQAGNEDALGALYRRRARDVYRFALQMSGSRALADDVTQEVFMVLIRDGHTFDPARGSLNAFLLGIARNHVLRRQRRERFYVSMEDESENGAKNKRLQTSVCRRRLARSTTWRGPRRSSQ